MLYFERLWIVFERVTLLIIYNVLRTMQGIIVVSTNEPCPVNENKSKIGDGSP